MGREGKAAELALSSVGDLGLEEEEGSLLMVVEGTQEIRRGPITRALKKLKRSVTNAHCATVLQGCAVPGTALEVPRYVTLVVHPITSPQTHSFRRQSFPPAPNNYPRAFPTN